jgi:uncharacterized protein (DUF58 family)
MNKPILAGPRRKPVSLRSTTSGEKVDRRWYYLGFGLLLASILLHLPLLVVCGLLLLLVLCTTDIWAYYCLHTLHYQRHLSERQALFGEEITLSVSVENAKLLPLPWLELEDMFPRALNVKGQQLYTGLRSNQVLLECLFSPRWYERVTRRYTVQCNSRGIHIFGPTTLRSGDVFGFIKREMHIPERQYLLIYPLVVPLSSFKLPAHHPFGDRRAPRRLLEDPSRVIGVRDYAYGDSLRRVHWKATARTMQLQSKVYEATTTYTLILFLNISSQFDAYYGIHPELQELAICAGASITDWAINQGYAVGLYANSIMFMPDEGTLTDMVQDQDQDLDSQLSAQMRRRRIRLPASSSEEQRKRIMEALARIQSYFGTSIEDVMLAERSRLPAGATIVLITSTITESIVDTLARIRQGGHAVTILFVGDTPPPIKLAGVTIYHLGGEETWERLKDAHISAQEQAVESIPAFHL